MAPRHAPSGIVRMNDERPVVAIIPARGGSKGLPGKNLMRVGGASLIGRAVLAARGSTEIDRIIVTTDDAAIAAEAKECGAEVPFLRPAELATDESTTADVVEHVLATLGIGRGYLVLLQPTSPLRTAGDVSGCLDLCRRDGAPGAVSVTEVDASPYWMFHLGDGGRLMPVVAAAHRPTRRQDAKAAFALNGAVYVTDIEVFRQTRSFVPDGTVGYVMSAERAVDIDTAADLEEARRIVREGSGGASRPDGLGDRCSRALPAVSGAMAVTRAVGGLIGTLAGRQCVVADNSVSLDDMSFRGLDRCDVIAVDQAVIHCVGRGVRPRFALLSRDILADGEGRALAAVVSACAGSGCEIVATDEVLAVAGGEFGAGRVYALSKLAEAALPGFDVGGMNRAGGGAAGLLVAVALGAERIGLIGADFGPGTDWRRVTRDVQACDIERTVAAFRAYEGLAELARRRHQSVLNVTPDSALAVFERMTLAAFFDAV